MSVTRTTSDTLIAILGSVQTVAVATTQTIGSAASGLSMLDRYIQDAKAEQLARSIEYRETMVDRIKEDSARDSARRLADLQREMQSDPVFAKLFKENYQTFANTTEVKIRAALAQLEP